MDHAGEGLVVTNRRTPRSLIDNNRGRPVGAPVGRFRKHYLVVLEGAKARVHPDHKEVARTRVDADIGYPSACPDPGSVVWVRNADHIELRDLVRAGPAGAAIFRDKDRLPVLVGGLDTRALAKLKHVD